MEINWLALILTTLIPTVVGFIYYHEKVMGSAWMEAVGMTEEKMKEANMAKVMGVSLIMSFMLAFFMMGFCNGPGQDVPEFDTFQHGAFHGAVLSLFILFPVFVTKGLYEHTPFKTTLIAIGYWLITLSLMGGVIDHMTHWG